MTPDSLIEAVRSWKKTPYHHRSRIKGVGVDCGQLVIAAHVEAGLVANFDTGEYTPDWHLHRDEDRYIAFVEEHLRRVDNSDQCIDTRLLENSTWEAPSASVIVFRIGRTFSHGGIITRWPNVVHSYLPSKMVEEVSLINTPMAKRPCRVYMHEAFL